MDRIVITVDTRATRVHGTRDGNHLVWSEFTPAGVEIVAAYSDYLRDEHKRLVSRLAADHAVHDLGCRAYSSEASNVRMTGLNLATRLPARIEISTEQLQNSIAKTVNVTILNIVNHLKHNPELFPFNSLEENRVILRGEFRNLYGLRQRLEDELGVRVLIED